MVQNSNRRAGSRHNGKSKELYIYGNTVRELQVERKSSIERKEDRQREFNQRRRNDKEYVNSMNKGYVFFLVSVAAIVFVAMGSFLVMSAKVTSSQEAVAELNTKTIDLKADNDDYERRIERSVNIDEIRRIAMEELGMVYPSKDQIVNYDYEESDFVRQYSDVPQD